MEKIKVMIIDEDVNIRKKLAQIVDLTAMAVVFRSTPTFELAMEWLVGYKIDLVFVSIQKNDANTINFINNLRTKFDKIAIILISDPQNGKTKNIIKGTTPGVIWDVVNIANEMSETQEQSIKEVLCVLFSQLIINLSSTKSITKMDNIKAENIPVKKPSQTLRAFDRHQWKKPDIIVIASSTGGPMALEILLSKLCNQLNTPVIIVQHMYSNFTKSLAESLDRNCELEIVEGKHRDEVRIGRIIIAPGNHHTVVEKVSGDKIEIKLKTTELVNGVMPAADVLFHSIAEVYKDKNVMVLILTGMGSDGCSGTREIKANCNCFCVTQSEKTCVVYGMPRCVDEEGMSDLSVDIEDMSNVVKKMCKGVT